MFPILSAIYSIAKSNIKTSALKGYDKIPENDRKLLLKLNTPYLQFTGQPNFMC